MSSSRQVVVVTGAGGMGQAIVRRIGSGCAVVLADFHDANPPVPRTLRGDGFDVHPVRRMSRKPTTSPRLRTSRPNSARCGASRTRPGCRPCRRLPRRSSRSTSSAPPHARRVRAARATRNRRGVHREHGGVVRDPARRDVAAARDDTHCRAAHARGARSERARRGDGLCRRETRVQVRVEAAALGWGRRGGRVVSLSPGIIATPQGNEERRCERRRHACDDRHVRARPARHSGRIAATVDSCEPGRRR